MQRIGCLLVRRGDLPQLSMDLLLVIVAVLCLASIRLRLMRLSILCVRTGALRNLADLSARA